MKESKVPHVRDGEREEREGVRTVITMQEACRAQRIQLAIRT